MERQTSFRLGALEKLKSFRGMENFRKSKDSTGKRGDTALHLAARAGSVAHVQKILAEIDRELVGELAAQPNQDGETALYVAAEKGHTEVVREILKVSDVQTAGIKASNSFDAFHIAAKQGYLDVLKELLQDFPALAMTINSVNATALDTAAVQGHIDIVNFLLETDASLAKIARNNGKTVLHSAARMGHVEIVRSLLNKDPGIGLRKDKKGQTALHMASKGTNAEIVVELLKPDISVSHLEDNKGNRPLHVATLKGNIIIVLTLLSIEGIDVNALNRSGETALAIAKKENNEELVNILRDAGGVTTKEPVHPANPAKQLKQTAREMVSASTGAMNSVLSKLAVLLVEESNPRTRSSIIALRYALTSMRSFLERRGASTEDMDPLVEGWMNQVRDMTYDLEDYIDDLVCPAAPSETNWVPQLLKMVNWRRQYTSLLQELKERVCEASERRWRYGIVCDPGNPMPIASDDVPIDGLLPIFNAHQGGGLVCVEDPRDRLIKLLTPDDQQQLKMVSIVGSRGIGKTTLAMEVYQSLKERFHCHTVVSVSGRHDLRKILISILSQVSMQEWDFTKWDEEQLIHKLSEFLKTKRYFIVIEDIWDVSAWKIIRWAFPENGCGSRILVTTSSMSIASPNCYFSEDNIFKMAPLSDSDARKLFYRTIFHPEYCCPSRLEIICTDILKKCGGLPLAIITIARLLAKKPDGSEWKRVRDGIASVLDKSSALEGMQQILHFAYFDLPFHLRTCLLYLAIFPEGYVIDKARLIRRWMAEGFIIEEHGKSSEEVGECYFSDLINRGLIQPVCIQYDGRIKACQVQNMILDLILSKSDEENFVTRYDDHGCIFGLQDRIRRLSLYCDHDKKGSFIPSVTTASHIRSLTIFMTDKEMPTLANFRVLRVLDLESCGELEDANYLLNIEKLHLLKYIRLQVTRFVKLPEHVGNLQFLQTLDLTRALIKQLPCSIVRLKQLIYLLVKNVKLPDGIGELQALQELSHVEVESSNPNSLEELGRLTMLRVLGLNWCIRDTDACTDICANSLISSLDKLGNASLQSLHIGSSSGCSLDFLLDSFSSPFNHLHEFRMTSDYYFPRIPEWMTSLVRLKLLEINIDTLGEEVLKILGKLPSLLVLLLSVKSAAPNQGFIIRSYGFQRLLRFDFICWNGLHMVMFEQGSMLALEKLHLKFRAKGVLLYYGFQFGIEHIASLRYLHVDIDCKDAEAREVEAAEDAVRGAISAHPGYPRLELRKLREEDILFETKREDDVVMEDLEITVHDGMPEGQNDVEPEEMVEEELISPYEPQHQQKQQAPPQLHQQQLDLIRRSNVFFVAQNGAIDKLYRVIKHVSRRIKGKEAFAAPPAGASDNLEVLEARKAWKARKAQVVQEHERMRELARRGGPSPSWSQDSDGQAHVDLEE